ncbi:hypothetical protein FQZ97_1089480 [compost metagenome]
MGLAVHAQQGAVGIGHRQGIEVGVAGTLEPAQGQHHAQLAGEVGEALEHGAPAVFLGQGEVLVVLLDAEVRRGEQLLQQDQLRALGGRFAHQLLGLVEVLAQVPAAGELGGGDGQSAHRLTPSAARPAVAG